MTRAEPCSPERPCPTRNHWHVMLWGECFSLLPIFDPFAVTIATLQAAHAAELVAVCARLRDREKLDGPMRQLVQERLFDAQFDLSRAREHLVDLGADTTAAVASVLKERA